MIWYIYLFDSGLLFKLQPVDSIINAIRRYQMQKSFPGAIFVVRMSIGTIAIEHVLKKWPAENYYVDVTLKKFGYSILSTNLNCFLRISKQNLEFFYCKSLNYSPWILFIILSLRVQIFIFQTSNLGTGEGVSSFLLKSVFEKKIGCIFLVVISEASENTVFISWNNAFFL